MRISDPFELEESLLWVIAATRNHKPKSLNEELTIVHSALERIYKKLEGTKIVINMVKE